MAADVVSIELSDAESDYLTTGLVEWGGPVAMTDPLARVIGFDDAAQFYQFAREMVGRVAGARMVSLTRDEWRSVLIASEINFASDVLGTGTEWEDFSAFTEEETLLAMRTLQRKLAPHIVTG